MDEKKKIKEKEKPVKKIIVPSRHIPETSSWGASKSTSPLIQTIP